MPDTFVHIKGIKKGFTGARQPFYSQTFVVHHNTQDELKSVINRAVGEIYTMQGMIIIKDELKKQNGDFNNIAFIPLHMISRVEFEIKAMVGEYLGDPEGVVRQ